MHVTVVLSKVLCGTEINIVQEGLPAVIPVEMCYLGWHESLAQLATLVESGIPGWRTRLNSQMYSSTFSFAKRLFDDEFHRLDAAFVSAAKAIPGYLRDEAWENQTTALAWQVRT